MRKVLVLILLLILNVSVFSQTPELNILSNGLKVITLEDASAPVVCVMVWYKVGSRNEQSGKTGISHLLEHMLFRSTKNFPKGAAERQIQKYGGITNGFTSYDFTGYYIFISSDKLELPFKIESDRMQNAHLDEKEQAPEMMVVRSELQGRENDNQYLLDREITATAFTVHPYRNPIIGYLDDFMNLKKSDLEEYYRTFYQPKNAVLVVVGDISTNQVLKLANKYFGKIKNKKDIPEIKIKEPKQNGEKRLVLKKEGSASYFQVVYHTPQVGHPDVYTLDLINQILSSGKTSRLYKKLILGNLAVDFEVSNYDTISPRLFKISAEVRKDIKPIEVEKAILEEIENIKKEGVSDKELKKAITQIETEFIYSLDSAKGLAYKLGFYETIYTHKYIDTYLDNLKKVTNEDIKRVASLYFTEDNRTVGYFVPQEL